jgi:hypothetical protein
MRRRAHSLRRGVEIAFIISKNPIHSYHFQENPRNEGKILVY